MYATSGEYRKDGLNANLCYTTTRQRSPAVAYVTVPTFSDKPGTVLLSVAWSET